MPGRYRVYVVQLKKHCPRCKQFRTAEMRCCVYVGMTSKSAEERLAEHLEGRAGYKATDVTSPDLA